MILEFCAGKSSELQFAMRNDNAKGQQSNLPTGPIADPRRVPNSQSAMPTWNLAGGEAMLAAVTAPEPWAIHNRLVAVVNPLRVSPFVQVRRVNRLGIPCPSLVCQWNGCARAAVLPTCDVMIHDRQKIRRKDT